MYFDRLKKLKMQYKNTNAINTSIVSNVSDSIFVWILGKKIMNILIFANGQRVDSIENSSCAFGEDGTDFVRWPTREWAENQKTVA